ncbi:MAG: hypothetical protein AAGC47_15315, partial [Bacteroidota bacterium]
KEIKVQENEHSKIANLLGRDRLTIDYFNPISKKDSTFENRTGQIAPIHKPRELTDYYQLVFKCLRYGDYIFFYIFWDGPSNTLIKIGQLPSLVDYQMGQLRDYSKVLDRDLLKEFTRAIGLAAHGIGIGSFVYLRRIFEKLIFEALIEAKTEGTIKEEDFQTLRMEDKILRLSDYLPEFLVENRKLYSILSIGLHQLDENTCLTHFETVKVGIELILDEREQRRVKKKKIKEAKQKIQELSAQFGKENKKGSV